MFQERPTGPGYKISLLISVVLVVLLLTLHFTGVEGLVKDLAFYGVIIMLFVLSYFAFKGQAKTKNQEQ